VVGPTQERTRLTFWEVKIRWLQNWSEELSLRLL
jgi:hypothetical protein